MNIEVEVYGSGNKTSPIQGFHIVISERFVPYEGCSSFVYIINSHGVITLMLDRYINMPNLDRLL